MYDLSASDALPVVALCAVPALQAEPASGGGGMFGAAVGGLEGRLQQQLRQGASRRVGLTGLVFNRKQRDLIAACDVNGRVHVFKLNWGLSNKSLLEQAKLNELGNIALNRDDE